MQTLNLLPVKHGFCGCAFVPTGQTSRAVVVATGSDGGIENAKYVAHRFAEKGLLALAVGYFGATGLPKQLVEIPLENIENALAWLRKFSGGSVEVQKCITIFWNGGK